MVPNICIERLKWLVFLAVDRIEMVLVFKFAMAHPYSKVREKPPPPGTESAYIGQTIVPHMSIYASDRQAHDVWIKPFHIELYEVTFVCCDLVKIERVSSIHHVLVCLTHKMTCVVLYSDLYKQISFLTVLVMQ